MGPELTLVLSSLSFHFDSQHDTMRANDAIDWNYFISSRGKRWEPSASAYTPRNPSRRNTDRGPCTPQFEGCSRSSLSQA